MIDLIRHQGAVVSSVLSSTLRAWRGTMQRRRSPDPMPSLDLYEFEGCPYCRLVREAISELQIDVTIYPCSSGSRYRDRAYEIAGTQTTFPFLVDHTQGVHMAESREIIDHLWRHYGGADAPTRTPLAVPTSILSSLARMGRGSSARPASEPRPASCPLLVRVEPLLPPRARGAV